MMGGSEEAQARRLECQKQMDGGEQSAAMFRLLLAGWLAGRCLVGCRLTDRTHCIVHASISHQSRAVNVICRSLWRDAAADGDACWLPRRPRGGVVRALHDARPAGVCVYIAACSCLRTAPVLACKQLAVV